MSDIVAYHVTYLVSNPLLSGAVVEGMTSQQTSSTTDVNFVTMTDGLNGDSGGDAESNNGSEPNTTSAGESDQESNGGSSGESNSESDGESAGSDGESVGSAGESAGSDGESNNGSHGESGSDGETAGSDGGSNSESEGESAGSDGGSDGESDSGTVGNPTDGLDVLPGTESSNGLSGTSNGELDEKVGLSSTNKESSTHTAILNGGSHTDDKAKGESDVLSDVELKNSAHEEAEFFTVKAFRSTRMYNTSLDANWVDPTPYIAGSILIGIPAVIIVTITVLSFWPNNAKESVRQLMLPPAIYKV